MLNIKFAGNKPDMIQVNFIKRFILFIIYVFIPLLSTAQKEANVWTLNSNVGIDFNYGRFTPFNGTRITNHQGGTTSICNAQTGQLLFYTDGRNVWNHNFKKMPNGTGLRGGYATAQASLIVPFPEKDHFYYLFTTKSYHDTIPHHDTDSKFTGLYYSIVDMQLNGGSGDLVREQKNIPLMELSTNKLTAIPHSNGNDYWLITHEWGTNRFVIYPITELGVGTPKYFSLGVVHTGPTSDESAGWLTPSPNGKMLVCAVHGFDIPLELYDFDATNGTISNLRELGRYPGLYGVSFSPDNSKLYFSFASGKDAILPDADGLYQMDLNAGSTEQIINSATKLYFVHETGVGGYDTLSSGLLQLAPDGRLYTELTFGDSERKEAIFYIDKPNLPGWQCDPTSREFKITANKVIGIGMPNFMQYYFDNLEPINNHFDKESCADITFKVFPNPSNGLIKIRIREDGYSNCLKPLKIRVYNSLGQLIYKKESFDESMPNIDLSEFAAGLYILSLNAPFAFKRVKVIKE